MKKKPKHKIILTGGGDSKHFRDIDLKFKSWLPPRCNILLVPLGTNRKNHNYALKRIKSTFKVLKFNNIAVCSDLSNLSWDFLSLFHAVYIDGGNTFTLMHHIQQAKVNKLFKKFLDHGGIINGDSAGAIVLGKKVDSAYFGEVADRNRAGLKDYSGLNFLSHWHIHCHYTEDEKEEIKDYVKSGRKLIALPDNGAVAVHGDKLRVIGKSSIVLYHRNKNIVIKPGKSIDLKSVF